jgi:steroid 5-alpha reductase family enzyme
MKSKLRINSKPASLAVVAIVYLIAFGAGGGFLYLLYAYGFTTSHPLIALLLADCLATILVFIANLIFGNASVYDPYWSVLPPFFVLAVYTLPCSAFAWRQMLLFVPLCLWAIRLAVNWVLGFDNLDWQDWRYSAFEKNYPRIYELIVFLGIMLMPTLLVYLGCIPLYCLIDSPDLSFLWPCLGGLIILLGTGLELAADAEMKAYKRDAGRGPYIYRGLWKYMRHPNYLGEMLVWLGVLVGSLDNFHLFSLPGFILIVLLFLFASIPMMEKHMAAKSPLYNEYRKKVRNFL